LKLIDKNARLSIGFPFKTNPPALYDKRDQPRNQNALKIYVFALLGL